MWPCSEKSKFWPIGPIPRVGMSASKIFGTMLLHSWFSLIWYATWPCSDKGEFWPTDPILRVRGLGVCAQNIWCHVAAFVIFFNLICNMSMFLKKCFDLLTPSLGWGRGSGSASKIFATMFVHSWFSLIWYITWLCSEKIELWPTDPIHRTGRGLGGSVRKLFVTMLVHSWFSLILYVTWPCSEKVNFDLLTPSTGSGVYGGGGGGGGGLRAKYLLPRCCNCDSHKFDRQYDRVLKKLNFDLLTPPSKSRGYRHTTCTKITFDMYRIFCTSVWMQNFRKNIDNLLSYSEI